HGEGTPGLGGGFDAGSGGEPAIEVANLAADRVCFGAKHRWREGEAEGDDAGGLKAGACAPQNDEAANHEARADKEYQRHRHFRDDERALRAMPRAACATAAFLERVVKMRVR